MIGAVAGRHHPGVIMLSKIRCRMHRLPWVLPLPVSPIEVPTTLAANSVEALQTESTLEAWICQCLRAKFVQRVGRYHELREQALTNQWPE
jgi:hypothetical protein